MVKIQTSYLSDEFWTASRQVKLLLKEGLANTRPYIPNFVLPWMMGSSKKSYSYDKNKTAASVADEEIEMEPFDEPDYN